MKKINISFSSEKDKENFVLECEREFHERLKAVSKRVVGSGAHIVLLSGPTCSGKTTLANKIISDFGKINKRVVVISIDDFFKTQLKTAKILEAEKIEGADKLLKLKIEVGSEIRPLVAGIALYYKPEELIGKTIVIVANLKPAKIRGVESCGMLLAAKNGDTLKLITTDGEMPSGVSIG